MREALDFVFGLLTVKDTLMSALGGRVGSYVCSRVLLLM